MRKKLLAAGVAAFGILFCMIRNGDAQEKEKAAVKRIAVRAGRMIDGKSESAIANALILVENDRIVAVSAGGTAPVGVEVIDLSNATVLPGFVDTHTHLLQ
jgi:imidazolonepropionase-like amidohydrolase